jgi:hypothetical protein
MMKIREIWQKNLYLKTTKRQGEDQGLLHPILDIFLHGCSLSSCPQRTPIRLASKSHVSLNYTRSTVNRIVHFLQFDLDYPTSGGPDSIPGATRFSEK